MENGKQNGKKIKPNEKKKKRKFMLTVSFAKLTVVSLLGISVPTILFTKFDKLFRFLKHALKPQQILSFYISDFHSRTANFFS